MTLFPEKKNGRTVGVEYHICAKCFRDIDCSKGVTKRTDVQKGETFYYHPKCDPFKEKFKP